MNRQKVYDTVKKHLLKQKSRSESFSMVNESSTGCLYRGPNGKKCAIGCLIIDGRYSKNIEGKGVSNPIVKNALYAWAKPKTENDENFLSELQSIHDDCYVNRWQNELKTLAISFGLKG